jgi:trimeric autotransporter adhesin
MLAALAARPGSPNNVVRSLIVHEGDLIAGGLFTEAPPQVSASRIARWDGGTWWPLAEGISGGGTPGLYTLASFHKGLIAGGMFSTAGGTAASNVARWDGGQWHPVGTAGMSGPSGAGVFALAVHGSRLAGTSRRRMDFRCHPSRTGRAAHGSRSARA